MGAPASRLLRASRAALVLALGVFLSALWQLSDAPPLGTDSLIYHLAIPAFWLQDGLFGPLDLVFHGHHVEYDPKLTQLINYALMSLCGDDGLTWLVQPACLAGLLAVFARTARLLGASRPLALALTSLLVFYPAFFVNMQFGNNDLALTLGWAMFCMGVALTPARPGRGFAWAVGGVSVVLATKTIGVIYALGAFPVLVAMAWALRGRPRLLVVGVLALLVGSASYISNLFVFGNPVYPSELRVAGTVVFPGLYDFSVIRTSPWTPSALTDMLVHSEHQFGPHAPGSVALWLGVLLVPFTLRGRRTARTLSRLAVGIGLPLGVTFLYLLLVPFWWEHRLLFPVYYSLWSGLAVTLAFVDRDFRRRGRRGLVTSVCLLLLLGRLWHEGFLSQPATGVAVLLAGGAWLWWPTPAHRRKLRLACGVAVLLGLAASPAWYPAVRRARASRRPAAYASHYLGVGELWNLIEERSKERGLTVAYAGTATTYPLFGSRLQNRVRYVRTSETDWPRPVTLHETDSLFIAPMAEARRRDFDPSYWVRGMESEQVELLLLHDDPNRGGIVRELAAARARPDRFGLVAEGRDVYGRSAFLFEIVRR